VVFGERTPAARLGRVVGNLAKDGVFGGIWHLWRAKISAIQFETCEPVTVSNDCDSNQDG